MVNANTSLQHMAEAVAELKLPPVVDRRLQALMGRNNDGLLSPEEHEELSQLVDWSESISLVRANAIHALGRRPE